MLQRHADKVEQYALKKSSCFGTTRCGVPAITSRASLIEACLLIALILCLSVAMIRIAHILNGPIHLKARQATISRSGRKKKKSRIGNIQTFCKPILEPKHAGMGTAAYLSLVSGKNPKVRKKSPM